MKSEHLAFLDDLPEEDRWAFYEELLAIAQQCLDLGSPVERFAERVVENIGTWAGIAAQRAEEDAEEPPLAGPILRHHYSYAHQRWDGSGWTDICRECDKPKGHTVHYGSGQLERSREDARYRSGDVVESPDSDVLWVVQGVGPYSYALRHLLHEEGEIWLSYSWDRDACETATTKVEPREL